MDVLVAVLKENDLISLNRIWLNHHLITYSRYKNADTLQLSAFYYQRLAVEISQYYAYQQLHLQYLPLRLARYQG